MIEYKGDDGTWHPYSAQVFRDMVIDLAKGLVGLGVNKGDSVAIVSRTRWEWTALDMAIMSIGALTVPVYETNSASQVSWIFNDSKVTLAIAEDDGQRDKIESVRDEVPTLRNVFVIEAGRSERHQDLRRKRHRRRILGIQGSLPRRRPRHHRLHIRLYRHPEGRGTDPPQLRLPGAFRAAVHASCRRMAQPPSAAVPAPEPCVRPIPGILQFWRHDFAGLELQYEDDGQGLRDLRPHAAACRCRVCTRRSTMPPPSAPAPDSLARCSCAPPRTRANGPRPSRRVSSCRLPDASPTPSTSRWCTRRFARFSVRTPTSPSPAALRWTPSFPTSSTASACRCWKATA